MSNFINYPQHLLSWSAELLFPKKCVICGKFNDPKFSGYLCKKCLNTLPDNHSSECIGCKRPTHSGKTCNLCIKTNPTDRLLVVADYKNQNLIKLIKLFKYRFIKDLGTPLFLLTRKHLIHLAKTKKFNLMEGNPLVIAVPLNKKRLNWRGFNQSDILAGLIAENFNLEKGEDIISRTGESKPQAELDEKSERLNNVRGLFEITGSNKITGRNVLLIDDVCTTGATLNECSKVLKENGARNITALVIARG